MKKTVFIIILLLCSPGYCENIFTMTGEKWAPYNNYIIDQNNPGFMLEIVQAVFKKKNISFEYTEEPWARAITSTRKGIYDALIGPAKRDAPDLIFPAEPIGYTVNSFFVLKDFKWQYAGTASLLQIKLGVLKSMTYGEELDYYINAYTNNPERIAMIFGLDYLERNFAKLKAKRIDATIDDLMVIKYFLRQTGQTELFKEAGIIDKGYGIYIAFSPEYSKAQQMADIITTGVRRLRKSGELTAILTKYGARDWK